MQSGFTSGSNPEAGKASEGGKYFYGFGMVQFQFFALAVTRVTVGVALFARL